MSHGGFLGRPLLLDFCQKPPGYGLTGEEDRSVLWSLLKDAGPLGLSSHPDGLK